jgi:hypothetical protein
MGLPSCCPGMGCRPEAEVLTVELMGFVARPVQGLYNFLHFERPDGAWLQIPLPVGRDKYIVYCEGDTSPIRKLEWTPDVDPPRQWEAMLAQMDR